MLGIKVPKEEGEKVRQLLITKNVLVKNYKIMKDSHFVYFPVTHIIPGYESVECEFEERPSHFPSLQSLGLSSFDLIGDIAVVEIPEEVQAQKREIAGILLARNPIHTVVEKTTEVTGQFRVRKHAHVLGEEKFQTIHTEYGLHYALDLNRVYFNPRLATERMRLTQKIKANEVIIDMFCGVGPFSVMISKYTHARTIYAIDINPDAIWYLRENIRMNRCENVIPICGDARKQVPQIGKADRILMNLPHSAFDFLPEALRAGKTLHYYCICESVEEEKERIHILAEKMSSKITIQGHQMVKSYAPHVDMYRIDVST
ncbi:MAG: class I SAM-dependent methyltransferase family protein [Theionarchaea archaeon]|nr:class I SAM-dependent methyltransferase family protein [Theionarchaea archaeon]